MATIEFEEDAANNAVAAYLKTQGYTITSQALGHTRGKDIVAARGSETLWVTVKGYPRGTAKTHHSTQASHYFKDALFDALKWGGDPTKPQLGVALPERVRYRNLAEDVEWFKRLSGFKFFWVQDDLSVVET